MTAPITYAQVEVGYQLPSRTFPVTRADLVRYAGASGDFNPIHWNERFARGVGLPDVIAHGMLTMAIAARAVTDWVGDPGSVVEYTVRFTKPVVVPDDERGAVLEVDAVVADKVDPESDGSGLVRVDLTARSAGEKVLAMARLLVRLPA